ncbi:MAG: ABC transporter permease [Massilimaliae sp.]|nr:ABC transporter permease [Massiliimalia sp.]
MTLVIGSLQLGLIYGLLALGVYITFRILNIPDLTADGSFTLGLAVSASFTVAGHPYLGILAAFLAGAAAGCVTGFLQTKVGIHPILAGILTMSGLYSVNLFVLGAKSNLSLIGTDTLFSKVLETMPFLGKDGSKLLIGFVFAAVCAAVLIWFFKTQLGLSIRATGNNEDMVRASSINVDVVKIIALAIANGCVGLSGAVIAQYQGFADVSSGVGMVVVGLASVIIGEAIMVKRSVTVGLVSAIAGSLVYRLIIALALKTSFFPSYMLKLVSAIIVAVALAVPAVKRIIQLHKIRKGGNRNA